MFSRQTQPATGLQVVVFIFAVAVLSVPFCNALQSIHPLPREWDETRRRIMPFALAALLLFSVPALRAQCVRALSVPISRQGRREVALVVTGKILLGFAFVGAFTLWTFLARGSEVLGHNEAAAPSIAAEWTKAFTGPEVVLLLLLGGILAPLIEELVFRGLLYRAWERRWGWLPAAVGTSLVFAAYHRVAITAFVSSMIFVCVMRRTGTLRAAIIVHSIYNMSLWYPLAGRFIFPREVAHPGTLDAYTFHLVCLAVSVVAVPLYVWSARNDRGANAASAFDAPLPKRI